MPADARERGRGGKNDGVMESAIEESETVQAQPYDAPEHLAMDIDELPNNYSIVIDAQVDVSDQTTWPVYTVEPASVTQGQADAVRSVLLGDTILYKQGEYRSRDEIQQSIDYYEEELQASVENGYQELVNAYTEILKELYIEYERTPEDLVLEEADTDFAFMESMARAELYGGKENVLEDGGIQFVWTDEARENAIASGCQNIYGVCWMDTGRKMVFSAGNNNRESSLYYSIADGNLVQDPGVTYSLDEGIEKADGLLATMGFDFVLVEAKTEMQREFNDADEFVEVGPAYHALTYKRSIDGVPQDNIGSCIDQNMGEDYSSPIPRQETIAIYLDDYGVRMFSWNAPLKVMAVENTNVTLIPFDDISTRIADQLKVQTLWDDTLETEAEWIESRRLEVYRVKLSYVMVAKSDDFDSYYLIPVWNVCGDLYYHYIDSYPTGESNTYVLDENYERFAWRLRYDTEDYSILTINAIDGSVIPRRRWT